jgi:hypothetical protein
MILLKKIIIYKKWNTHSKLINNIYKNLCTITDSSIYPYILTDKMFVNVSTFNYFSIHKVYYISHKYKQKVA